MERLKTADTGRIVTLAVILAGAIFLLIGCLSSTQFATYTVQGVANGMAYGVLGLALVLIYQATRVINFAQGELAMLTTFIAYQLIQWGLSYWEAFFATLAIGFVLGIAIQLTVIRPVQHRSVIATVIVTVGLFILIDGVVNWVWGGEFRSLPSPFGYGSTDVGGVSIQHLYVGMVGVVLACLAAVWALFRFTKLGLAMRAAALRPAAASLAGVRVDAMLAIGWGLAALLGAVAGLMVLPSAQLNFLLPTFMQAILVYAFAAAALGGLESPAGAIVGGLAIGVLQAMMIGYVPQIGSQLQLPFAFALILADPPRQTERPLRPPAGGASMKQKLLAVVAVAVVAVVLVLLPFVLSDYNTYLAGEVGIFFIAILGLNILTGYTGQISIGHGAFMAIGGYTAAIMSRDHETNLVYGTLLAFAVCFVIGLLFGLPALRLHGAYLALATFALAISIPQLPLQWSNYLGGSLGVQSSSKTTSPLRLVIARRRGAEQPLDLRRRVGICRGQPATRVADPPRARRPGLPGRPRQRGRCGGVGSRDRAVQDARLRDLGGFLRSRRSALRPGVERLRTA